jgi:C-terminal processing protease CtpA/Prc
MPIFKKILYVVLLFFIASKFALANSEQKNDVNTIPLDEIRVFTEIFSKIKSDYVENIDDEALLENAIRGMLQGLDPHSAYLDKEAYKELQEGTSGEFGGLGIEVGYEDGFVKVISPIDDTPAQRAGIKAGDLIIRLDGKSAKGISLMEAVKIMRGKPGSKIELTILREGKEKPFNISIVRDVITIINIRAEIIVITSRTILILKGFSLPSLSMVNSILLPGLPLIILTASISEIPLADLPSKRIIKSPALIPARCAGVSSIGDITLTKPSS